MTENKRMKEGDWTERKKGLDEKMDGWKRELERIETFPDRAAKADKTHTHTHSLTLFHH